jgi:hypothetical protein
MPPIGTATKKQAAEHHSLLVGPRNMDLAKLDNEPLQSSQQSWTSSENGLCTQ